MKICHVSSAHPSTDTRVFIKECSSLASAGFETYLVIKGESRVENNVNVVGVGNPPKSRIKRMLFFSKKVFKKSLELDCELYHLHDPELLQFVKKYKKRGKKVIFDSHEDVSAQIEDKYWIPRFLRKALSKIYQKYEASVVKKADAVIAATPYIGKQFEGKANKVVVINNYPKLDDILFQSRPFVDRNESVCFTGYIDDLRGEKIMVEAMKESNATLIIAGDKVKATNAK